MLFFVIVGLFMFTEWNKWNRINSQFDRFPTRTYAPDRVEEYEFACLGGVSVTGTRVYKDLIGENKASILSSETAFFALEDKCRAVAPPCSYVKDITVNANGSIMGLNWDEKYICRKFMWKERWEIDFGAEIMNL